MTWPVRDALVAGKTTVVFACGAIEQHGLHLPLATDTYLGTAIAERAARIAGNTLVAPTLRPGLSEHHMEFPGSLTLRFETFMAVIEDYCVSLASHGFTRIVIFPSHGGNADTMKAWAPRVARTLGARSDLVVSLRGASEISRMRDHVARYGVSPGHAGVHAGYLETSMMLAYMPELVVMSAAEPGRVDEDFYRLENLQASQMESFLFGIRRQSSNGVLGDPVGANAAQGEQLLELAAAAVARDLTRERASVRGCDDA
ncbi:MAG: creatininase family protein [Gaiellaceae bacterium]